MFFKKTQLKPWKVMQISKLVHISQLPDSGCHYTHLENNTIKIAADINISKNSTKTLLFIVFSAVRAELMMYC